jgi:hypothetical protein
MLRIPPIAICPCLAAFLAFVGMVDSASGQAPQDLLPRVPVLGTHVVNEIDETQRVVIRGNTHPLTAAVNDRGAVPPDQPMERMLLLLRRSPEREAALEQFLAAQQDPKSLMFHQWLTPQQFGANFGPAPEDLQAILSWLASHGFKSVNVNQGDTVIEFSGTAAAVQSAFGTAIHRYEVAGTLHLANQSDPSIPTALSPVVQGVVSLNDFRPRSMAIRGPSGQMTNGQFRSQGVAGPNPQFTIPEPLLVTTFYWLSPYDFATIYDLLPLWNAGLDGTGQTIAIVGQTDINLNDPEQFRALFGLPVNNPTVVIAGADPGIQPDEIEADLDVEWSGAVARGAKVELVSSASTETTAGVDLAALYIIDNNLAPVMSESYGDCEMFLGTTANAFEASMWQQAAAEGITVLVSSGDQGSAVCDAGQQMATHAMSVNGLASTPYNVAVGGTDFNQSGMWTQYWSSTNDPVTKQSVLGYIPEIPWNDSCGSSVLATLNGGNSANWCGNTGLQYEDTIATSGGPSSCISSNGTDVASCTGGWPKPVWQTGLGVPADGVRDVPDVSLFASNNVYSSMYVTCQVDLSKPPGCDPTATTQTFNGLGGTSASAPAMAGVMAIINQKYGRQGNANYTFYRLAASAVGASVFHDITTDGNRVTCDAKSPDCEIDPTTTFPYGRLKGHDSTVGYDMVTGLGSVDIANLVNNWGSIAYTPTKTTMALNGGTNTASAVHGSAVSASVNVTTASGSPTGDVSLIGSAVSGSFYLGHLQSGSAAGTLNALPGGSYAVTAHYEGDTQFAASDSSPVSVSISPEPSTTRLSLLNYDPTQSNFVPSAPTVPYGSLLLLRADVKGQSGFGNATGSATLTDGTTSLGKFNLNAQGFTEYAPNNLLLGGAHGITASYSGDPSFNASSSAAAAVTVTPTQVTCFLGTNTTFLRPGWVLVASPISYLYQPNVAPPLGTMVPPTGTLSIYAGSTPVSGPTAGTGNGSGSLSGGAFRLPGISSAVVTLPASLFTSNLPITMTYSGDSNYAPCTSPPLEIPYQTAPMQPQLALTLPQSQDIVQGTPITASVIISSSLLPVPYEPPYPAPTGTYGMAVDGVPAGSPVAVVPGLTIGGLPAGTATVTIPTTNLSIGMHTLTETYSGDSNYQPYQLAGIDYWIVIPDFSVTPNLNTLTVTNGQTTSPVTIQVGSLNGFAGTVNFSCSGLPSQSACVFSPSSLTASGSTSMTITTTQAQSVGAGPVARNQHSGFGWTARAMGLSVAFVVVFAVPKRKRKTLTLSIVATVALLLGTMSCGGGGGNSSPIQSSPNQTTTSLVADTNTPAKGATDTFTATVNSIGSNSTPSGTVQFDLDGVASGTPVGLNQGAAKYQTSFSLAGSHTVTAVYSGDANNLSSTSGNLAVTVPYTTGSLPGTYAVTITATSGTLTHSVPLTLQVQ